MAPKTHFDARLAVLLANLAAIGLVGCVADESTLGDETVEAAEGSEAFGLGARGAEVREVYDYLRRYGYFQNEELAEHYPNWKPAVASDPADPEIFDDALETGVKLFQRAAGLPETGLVDAEMRAIMKLPRCEFPDYYNPPSALRHSDQHNWATTGGTWSSSNITYRFANYTSDLSQSAQRSAIETAMFWWRSASAVSFSEVSSGENITLGFYSGDHGDGYPFDGASNVLAHAFYPNYGGDLHFDDAETWSTSSSSGIHLTTVAAHELGHSMGLAHSSVTSAIMYAYYSGARSGLTYDDHAGIWSLYGAYSSPSGCGGLGSGQGLGAGQSVYSCDGRFHLDMQGDGNLVLYWTTGGVLWASNTNGAGGDRAFMQEDGNLVIYKSTGEAVWSTGTAGSSNYYATFAVQNDGNLVIYRSGGGVAWASNTCCH